MGKFSFDKDFAKRVSMHRDPEQHKKRGDNLNARKKQIFNQNKTTEEKAKTAAAEENKAAANAASVLSDKEIGEELNRLTAAFRATNGGKRRRRTPRFCRAAPSEPAGGNGGFQNRQERYCADGFQRRRGKADGQLFAEICRYRQLSVQIRRHPGQGGRL